MSSRVVVETGLGLHFNACTVSNGVFNLGVHTGTVVRYNYNAISTVILNSGAIMSPHVKFRNVKKSHHSLLTGCLQSHKFIDSSFSESEQIKKMNHGSVCNGLFNDNSF